MADENHREKVQTDLNRIESQYDSEGNDVARRRRLRDEYGRKMLGLIDHAYQKFVSQLAGSRKSLEAGATITAVSLDAASVLAGANSTKSLLAALSAVVTVSHASIDKAFFYEQAMPVLVSQMAASRLEVLNDIHSGLALDDSSYPMHRLFSDLRRYYDAGTIEGALEGIQRSAGAQSSRAITDLTASASAELAEQDSRRRLRVAELQQRERFESLRSTLPQRIGALDTDLRDEVLHNAWDYAAEAGIDLTNTANERLAPESLPALLEGLDFGNRAHRVFLAKFAADLPYEGDGG